MLCFGGTWQSCHIVGSNHPASLFIHGVFERSLVSKQGPKDVYRGLTGAVLGTIPTAMLYFTTYEWCKTRLEARGAPSAITHLASASAGAVMSAFIRVPTDTIKHRVQAYMETDVFLVSPKRLL